MNEPTSGVVLRGVLRDKKSGDPVFYAKVRLPGHRAAIHTGKDGKYKFIIPPAKQDRSVRVIVLKSGYWPLLTHLVVPKNSGEAAIVTDLALEPLPDFMSQGIVGYIASLAGPRLFGSFLGLTRLEMVFSVLGLLVLFPPVALGVIARGLPLKGTEMDEVVREFMLAQEWPFVVRKPVVFASVRPAYLPNVTYVIPAGEHVVTHPVEIRAGSEVTVEAGAVFKLEAGAGFLVRGRLKVAGSPEAGVVFRRAEAGRAWGNITFWQADTGSKLSHCRIEGGGGRRTSGSASGVFQLNDSGTPNGGGVLIYNTQVIFERVEIEKCQAVFGGAIYLRNSPDQVGLPGSRFKDVRILECVAEPVQNTGMAGGGGVFFQRTHPHFEDSLFEGNKAKGDHSCGGAVYLGREAQAVFDRCTFMGNMANRSGGALYAREALETDEEMLSGLNIQDSKFENNQARGTGGAICAENTRVRLTDVTFLNNAVSGIPVGGQNVVTASGGAVYLSYSETFAAQGGDKRVASSIQGCTFTYNRADAPDGAEQSPDHLAGGALAVLTAAPVPIKFGSLHFNSNTARYGRHVAVPPSSFIQGWNGQWTAEIDPRQELVLPGAVRVIGPLLSMDASHPLPPDCYGDRPDGVTVSAVVLHYISAVAIAPEEPYNLDKILGIFKQQSTPPEPAKTSAHYLLDRNGRIHLLVDEKKRAWHAGQSRLKSGEEDVNDFSIGIEIMMTSEEAPTSAQYASLGRLVADIRRRHPAVHRDRIVGHQDIRNAWNEAHPHNPGAPKHDPGPKFDWCAFLAHLDIAEQK